MKCAACALEDIGFYQCEYIEENMPEEYQKIKVIYREKKKVEKIVNSKVYYSKVYIFIWSKNV